MKTKHLPKKINRLKKKEPKQEKGLFPSEEQESQIYYLETYEQPRQEEGRGKAA